MTARPDCEFVDLPEASVSRWCAIDDFREVWPAISLALTASEILQTAHQFPILVSVQADTIRVEALMRDDFLVRPTFDADSGRCLRDYLPMALRSLPFRLGQGTDRLQIRAENLRREDGWPLYAETGGQLAPQVERVRATLVRERRGLQETVQAARLLFATGLLSPIEIDAARMAGTRFFSVDVEAFSRLAPLQVAALGYDGFAALDLATACIFSRQFLKSEYRSALPRDTDVAPGSLTVEIIDQLVRNVGQLDFELDDGSLIEIDGFISAIET